MSSQTISGGTAHKLPNDFKKALTSSKTALEAWEDITPLARNEFICWVEDAKQEKTRIKRINQAVDELNEGQRRPCCWVGCIHRADKPMNATQKWMAAKKSKK